MKTLKGALVIAILALSVNYLNNQITTYLANHKTVDISNDTIKGIPYKVVATMYHPTASQCDSDPNITAGLYRIPKNATEQKWIAMSRDLISRWGGEFSYGDLVQIHGAGHKDGIYKVVDTMNKRYTSRIDFLESKGTKPYKFNNVTLTKITWNRTSQQEKLLTSL